MADELEMTTVTLESDGVSDTLEIPVALIEMLTESDESIPTVVADIAMFGLAQRVHTAVHHSEGDPSAGLDAYMADIEAATDEQFEERFGTSFDQLLDHSH